MLQHLLNTILEGLIWMLCSRQTRFLISCYRYAYLVHSYISSNGDKFHPRKFTWAADEKQIINELGPKLVP